MKEQLRTEAEKDIFNELSFTGLDKPFVNSEENTDDALVFLKTILNKGNVRQYLNINDFGYSQIERDIVNGIKKFGHFESYNFHAQQLEKDNWVSVSERLPEENQTVWCYSEKLDNVFLGEYVYVMNEGCFWAGSNGVIYASGGKIVTECEIDDFDVSHWYPTPTLPKKLTTQTL